MCASLADDGFGHEWSSPCQKAMLGKSYWSHPCYANDKASRPDLHAKTIDSPCHGQTYTYHYLEHDDHVHSFLKNYVDLDEIGLNDNPNTMTSLATYALQTPFHLESELAHYAKVERTLYSWSPFLASYQWKFPCHESAHLYLCPDKNPEPGPTIESLHDQAIPLHLLR